MPEKYLNETGLSHFWDKIKSSMPSTAADVGAIPAPNSPSAGQVSGCPTIYI